MNDILVSVICENLSYRYFELDIYVERVRVLYLFRMQDSYFIQAIIGGFSCMVAGIALNPLDVIKVRLEFLCLSVHFIIPMYP
jgi:hypothetical protein